jgi:hypothetical protein
LPLIILCFAIRRAGKTVLLAQAIVALACQQIQAKHKGGIGVTADFFYCEAFARPLGLCADLRAVPFPDPAPVFAE